MVDWLVAMFISSSFLVKIELRVAEHRTRVGLCNLPFALLAEREQVAVHNVGMCGGEPMRQARIVDFDSSLNQRCRLLRRVFDGYNLIVLTVHDQSRDIELLE